MDSTIDLPLLPNNSPGQAEFPQSIGSAIEHAQQWLVREQQPEGFWVGMLESNCCMEAQWILGMHFLGVKNDPKLPGVIRAILREQRLFRSP